MPHDDAMWKQVAGIEALDNLGTDLYWVNNDRDVAEMVAPITRLGDFVRATARPITSGCNAGTCEQVGSHASSTKGVFWSR